MWSGVVPSESDVVGDVVARHTPHTCTPTPSQIHHRRMLEGVADDIVDNMAVNMLFGGRLSVGYLLCYMYFACAFILFYQPTTNLQSILLFQHFM